MNKNLVAGILFAGFGVLGLWFGRTLRFGTLGAIESGFVPMVACSGLIAIGLVKIGMGVAGRGGSVPLGMPRGFLFVALGLVLFGLLIEKQGLVMATAAATIAVEFAGNHEKSWRKFSVLLACLLVSTVLVFKYLLGVSVEVLPTWI